MRLPLFSSRAAASPNLVGIQHPDLALPTVLVCPIWEGEALTNVRTAFEWEGRRYTVLCELARPINRRTLRQVGELEADTAEAIIKTFLKLLPI